MKRIFNLNLDVTDFVLGEIEKVAELISSKSFSKEAASADIPSRSEMEHISDDKVALVMYHPQLGEAKKYADYNKELTELNVALLEDKHNVLPDEVVKVASTFLQMAARRWRVDFPTCLAKYASPNEIKSNYLNVSSINENAYMQKLMGQTEKIAMEKVASYSETCFALPKERKYLITNENQIKVASAYFETYSNSMTPSDKLTYAYNVKNAADTLHTGTSEYIEKYASLITNEFNPDLGAHLRVRASYTRCSDHQDLYDELGSRYEELGVIKTAAALEKIDELCGLTRLYNYRIEEPMLAVCGNEKIAHVIYEGKTITAETLVKLAGMNLTDIIDSETMREFQGSDGLAVFESLPTPVKDALVSKI